MRKRLSLLFAALVMAVMCVNAQVTIGTKAEPHAGAVLDLQSNNINKGLLLPNVSLNDALVFQVATGAENIATGKGMMVYNTNAGMTGGAGVGVYIWNGSEWMPVSPDIPCNGAPTAKITSDIPMAQVNPGDAVKLTVNASGNGALSYQWYKNGTELSGATNVSYAIASVVLRDQYSVKVTDKCGTTSAVWTTCGAFKDGGVWLPFMCYNLGADESLDPFTPHARLTGDYYKYGQKEPALKMDDALTNYGPIESFAGKPYQSGDTWDAADDPCPEGWRLPSHDEVRQVLENGNNQIRIMHASIIDLAGGWMIGDHLFLTNHRYRAPDGSSTHDHGHGLLHIGDAPTQMGGIDTWDVPAALQGNATLSLSLITDVAKSGLVVRCVAE